MHICTYTYTNVFSTTYSLSLPLPSSILVKMDSWARLGEVWRADVDDKIAVVTRQMKWVKSQYYYSTSFALAGRLDSVISLRSYTFYRAANLLSRSPWVLYRVTITATLINVPIRTTASSLMCCEHSHLSSLPPFLPPLSFTFPLFPLSLLQCDVISSN